jgi:methylenetetrahydrofolate reductase (NADPH)
VSPAADLLVDWLRRPRFEVIPVEGVEDELLRHVPTRLTVTVSASPTRGLEPTLMLCERLVAHAYPPCRTWRRGWLPTARSCGDVLERIHDVGVREACMSGGSSPDLEPHPTAPGI